MNDYPACPECGTEIRPSDSVARHPDGMCHIRCLPRPVIPPAAEGEDDTPTP